MGKRKRKKVVDKEESEFKSSHGRIPVAPPSQEFTDKSKYNRKKYKEEE